MNCERLNIHDFLDDALSPSAKAAAQAHIAACLPCREAVQRERQLAESFSRWLEQAVQTVVLDAVSQRGIAAAVERELAVPRERPPVSFWGRLVLPFATAAAILMAVVWTGYHFVAGQRSHLETVQVAPPARGQEVSIHVSYSVPGYTFRKEGNLVIDALTSDRRIAEGTLLVKNEQLQSGEN